MSLLLSSPSVDIEFANVFFDALMSGEYSFVDLADVVSLLEEEKPKKKVRPTCGFTAVQLPEFYDGDEAWEPKVFMTRKEIWETFPVSVIPLGRFQDGAERHAISWHKKNLAEWQNDPVSRLEGGHGPTDSEEWATFEDMQYAMLMDTLRISKKWVVEPALSSGQICVIRMLFTEPMADATRPDAPAAAPAAATRPLGPVFNRLNDIKEHFPVVWNKVEGARRSTYTLDWKRTEVMRLSRDVVQEMTQRLLSSLRASRAWKVLDRVEGSVKGSELCRLEMA